MHPRSLFMRLFFKRTDSSSDKDTRPRKRGCVPVYVGEEAKRYDVPLKYMLLPVFKELLRQDLDDGIGYFDPKIDGPLRITSCTTSTFDNLLKIARQNTC